MLEVRRQAFHLVFLTVVGVLLIYLPFRVSAFLAFVALAGALAISVIIASRVEESLPPRLRIFRYLVAMAERRKTAKSFPFYGSIIASIAVGLSLLLLRDRAFIPILVLAWGDSTSTVVGIYLGRHKLFAGRSLEGSVGFFLASLVPLFLVTSLSAGKVLAIALTATLVEIFSPIDDNITIPLAVSVLVKLIA